MTPDNFGPVASLRGLWQLAHFPLNKALPAATSCAETVLMLEKTKRKRTNSVSFWTNGLQGIIDTIDAEKCG